MAKRDAPPIDEDPNPYWIMTGLVYPGILATFLFEFFKEFKELSWENFPTKGLLVLLLIIHYAFDYAYTVDDRTKKVYSWPPFFLDLIIVILMAFAIFQAKLSCLLWVSVGMFLTKCLALGWELTERKRFKNNSTWLGTISDGLPTLLYFFMVLYYSIFSGPVVGPLILVVLVDIVLYVVHPYKRWQDRLSEYERCIRQVSDTLRKTWARTIKLLGGT